MALGLDLQSDPSLAAANSSGSEEMLAYPSPSQVPAYQKVASFEEPPMVRQERVKSQTLPNR